MQGCSLPAHDCRSPGQASSKACKSHLHKPDSVLPLTESAVQLPHKLCMAACGNLNLHYSLASNPAIKERMPHIHVGQAPPGPSTKPQVQGSKFHTDVCRVVSCIQREEHRAASRDGPRSHSLVQGQGNGACAGVAIARQVGHHSAGRHFEALCCGVQDALVGLVQHKPVNLLHGQLSIL